MNNTLTLELIIDGQKATATIDMLDLKAQVLSQTLTETGRAPMIKEFYTDLMTLDKITDEASDSIAEFITYNNVSETEIYNVVNALREEQKTLGMASDAYQTHGSVIANIGNAQQKLATRNYQYSNETKTAVAGTQQMNMAMMQLGYAFGDASMFAVNFRMGLMGIMNNMQMVIQLALQSAASAKTMGMSFMDVAKSSIGGVGGIMVAVNGMLLLLQLLPGLFDDTTESVKEQSKEVDTLANKYEKLTRRQLENENAMVSNKLTELTKEFQSKYGNAKLVEENSGLFGWIFGGLVKTEMTEAEQKKYESLLNQKKALDETASKLGYIKNLENEMNQLLEKRKEIKNPAAVTAYDLWIDHYQKLIDKTKLVSPEERSAKAFEAAEEQLTLAQQHTEEMARIQGDGDLLMLDMKKGHLAEMIELYKSFGKDTTALQYKLIETDAQITKKTKPNLQYDMKEAEQEMYEDVDKPLPDVKIMHQEELEEIRINSINNEFERQRALADYQYQIELEKYKDYQNFSEIKTALDQEYSAKKNRINEDQRNNELALASQTFASLGALFAKHTAAYKAVAIAQAIINTYEGATKALAQGGIFGPALAAVVIASGMAQVLQIQKQDVDKFETGGLIKGRRHSEGGVIIEAEDEEYIMNRNATRRNFNILSALNAGYDINDITRAAGGSIILNNNDNSAVVGEITALKNEVIQLQNALRGIKLVVGKNTARDLVQLGNNQLRSGGI